MEPRSHGTPVPSLESFFVVPLEDKLVIQVPKEKVSIGFFLAFVWPLAAAKLLLVL
jgi:hypothetical protein